MQRNARHAGNGQPRPILITGGAGFIGTNLAAQVAESGHDVLVFDNLARPGVERNLKWLRESYARRVRFELANVQDAHAVQRAVAQCSAVYHFAAQVAVTTSLDDPLADFETNARGTLNVLEACRRLDTPPPLLFTSTNKVYGDLGGLPLHREGDRYVPNNETVRQYGISEQQPLDFHSPYGCSKGVADQYVLDYARSWNLPTVVFRMSCIYGPHQCGTEDQGWVAHFVRRMFNGQPITFYGDGCQVRDLLFVKDLVRAHVAAREHIDRVRGQAFNIGGGPANAASLREVVDEIARLHGEPPAITTGEWRTGDQRYYVSDTRRFQRLTGWQPQVSVKEGLSLLYEWLESPERTLAAAR